MADQNVDVPNNTNDVVPSEPAVDQPLLGGEDNAPETGDKPLLGGEDNAPETEGDAAEGKETEGDKEEKNAPEKYELELPEGVELTEEDEAMFRELDLTNDQAKRISERYMAMVEAQQKAQEEALRDMRADWRKTVQKDEELGGADFKAKLGVANKALKQFGPELLADITGKDGQPGSLPWLGDYPNLLKLLHRVGKGMSEDTFHEGGGSNRAEKSAADVIYGS